MAIEIDDRDWFSWSGIASIRGKCEAQAASEGLAGLELFMRGQELFTEQINLKPTYRQRQEAWRAKQPQAKISSPEIEALEAIAAGHNDARGLAASVLRQIHSKERSGG